MLTSASLGSSVFEDGRESKCPEGGEDGSE